MIGIKKDFTPRELLWFGPLFGLFGGMIGGLTMWKLEWPELARGIWFGSVVLIFLYYSIPPWRRGIFTGWMMAVFPLGWILSHVLLMVVFYGVVFPIGLLMRLFRHDALTRRFDPEARSYWVPVEKEDDPRRYFRQF